MKVIKIMGLGPGDLSMMPIGIYEELSRASPLYLRTREHPAVQQLEAEGIAFNTFDFIYEQHEQFTDVYEQIVKTLLAQFSDHDTLHYAVPGHPLVAEQTVQLLLQQATTADYEVCIVGGQSFLDPMLAALQIDPIEGLLILDGTALFEKHIHPECHLIITQVYDARVASEVKLSLMQVYPDEYPVSIVTAAGIDREQRVITIPLYELDRVTTLSNLTSVYLAPTSEEKIIHRQYFRSREIFRQLRGENGCPWDKKQTHQSLKKYLVEETNEVIEAIDEGDVEHLIEELGDVLLQVFLHAQIGEDEGLFSMEDILQGLNDKMVRRHPHVFGDVHISTEEELKELWEKSKEEERRNP